jgi:hypothetical protein
MTVNFNLSQFHSTTTSATVDISESESDVDDRSQTTRALYPRHEKAYADVTDDGASNDDVDDDTDDRDRKIQSKSDEASMKDYIVRDGEGCEEQGVDSPQGGDGSSPPRPSAQNPARRNFTARIAKYLSSRPLPPACSSV